jgi:glycosyltransferase involved in cell wall biosynthesis
MESMSKDQLKPKKVCIIRQKYYPQQRNMRRNAENLNRNGYKVDVICVGDKSQKKYENQNGINIHRVYFSYHRNSIFWYLIDYFAFFTLVSFNLAQFSIKERYDVIEVCNVPDFLVFATAFPKLLGSKVIFNMFEKTESLFATSFGLSRKHLFTRIINFITKMAVHYADYVILTDVVVHKQIVEDFGIPKSKTTLVLNVPDESVFNLEPVYTADDNHHFVITVVSTILKRYGIQTMIEAMPLLLKDIPELKVFIVGNGEFLPHLRQMAKDMGINEHVDFTDYVPYDHVSAYIARADVCVAPMIDDVGTPNKILEYFALGKATVSTDLPGLKALCDDNSLLYFKPANEVELAERILELYRNPAKRAALGQSAFEFYNKYRWPVMLKRYLEVYKKLSV